MTNLSDLQHDLKILDEIEQDPETTQATLASQLGVAVGTVNWHLKRLIAKGYVKVRRAQRRKLKYIITPEGVSHRARLTLDYINNSFHLFRLVRERMLAALHDLPPGVTHIRLHGESDVAEVCRLTCIEHGYVVLDGSETSSGETVRSFNIVGLKIFPEEQPSAVSTEAAETKRLK